MQASTDTGFVQMFDVRNDSKPLWTLQAHSEAVNGLTLSTQCPDMLTTVSSDKTMKVWDISGNRPFCVQERDMSLGELHCLDACPDAPFVICMGGDKPAQNLKVRNLGCARFPGYAHDFCFL